MTMQQRLRMETEREPSLWELVYEPRDELEEKESLNPK